MFNIYISFNEGDFCENKTATYYDDHPMGCPFFVWCVTGRAHGQVCPANNQCINHVSGRCEKNNA